MTDIFTCATHRILFAILLAAFLQACSKNVLYEFETLNAAKNHSTVSLTEDVAITLDTGYTRILKRNTKLELVGTVSQGNVYKPVDMLFTVEGANVHEAYLVVKHSDLVGFYLTGKNSFTKLTKTVKLNIE